MATPKAKKGQKGFDKVEKVLVICSVCKKNKLIRPDLVAQFKWCSNECKGKSMESQRPHNKLSLDKLIYVACSLPTCKSSKAMLPCRVRRAYKLKQKIFCCKEHAVLFRKQSYHEEVEIQQLKQEEINSRKQIWGIN